MCVLPYLQIHATSGFLRAEAVSMYVEFCPAPALANRLRMGHLNGFRGCRVWGLLADFWTDGLTD